MTYDVVWSQVALEELSGITTAATRAEVQRLTVAVRSVERQLRTDAPNAGESRSEGRRILIARPIAVVYRIEDRTVRIDLAWWCVP